MDVDRFLVALEHHARLLSEAARSVDLETSVPTCPGWTVRDLAVHTGIVHRHKTEVVRGGYLDSAPDEPTGPDGDVMAWYDEGVAEMLAVFGAADLDAPTWTWSRRDQKAEWWVRRMAHESLIHGADALLAARRVPGAEEWLAVDGVDELIDEFMTGGPRWSVVESTDRRIDLVARDRTWGLRTALLSGTDPRSGTRYDAYHTFVHDRAGLADATIRSDAETLDFWLWGRAALPDDAVTGDRSLVAHVRSTAAEATQ
jgi:uncharacterized protein (TIGR03083 family)